MVKFTGYHKLARFMVDEKYTIFRMFKEAACRDLLLLQAEISKLEDDLSLLQERDRKADGEYKMYDRNWYLLSTAESRGRNSEQWAKTLEIRSKLREYHECVSRYSLIANDMPRSRKRDVAMLKDWIVREDLGGGIIFSGDDLSPVGKTVYDKSYSNDLMTLDDRMGENDLFTKFFLGPAFHTCEKSLICFKRSVLSNPEDPSMESNLLHYSDSHVIGAIEILGTAIASMTPLVSIIILHFVRSLGARLGVLCACTFLFSMSLAFVTKARRTEVFACTAAFASVQVVFVGSASLSGSG